MNEADWKAYKKNVDHWRERHLEQVNARLKNALSDPNKTPTEAFWDTEEKLGEEAKVLQHCFREHKRSSMKFNLTLMLGHGIITKDDLSDFSGEMREGLSHYWEKASS